MGRAALADQQTSTTRTASDLPPGVIIRLTGDAEVMGEVLKGLLLVIGARLMMVYALLVLLFGSFLQRGPPRSRCRS